MQRVSISGLSTSRWSLYRDAIRYLSHGFSSMGIWRQKVDDFGESEAIEFLFEMDINVSSVHWAGGFTGSDGRTSPDMINDTVEAIHLARQLNADCLIVHPGSRNGHTYSHASRLLQQALEEIAPIANDFEVKLVIEPMMGHSALSWTFLQSFQETLDVVKQFSHEGVGLVLDLYHVGLNRDVFENLESIIPHVELVQLADRQSKNTSVEYRHCLGTGDVPINSWLNRIQQLGYAGAFEVELHGPGMQGVDYDRRLKRTREFMESESVQSILAIESPRQIVRPNPSKNS